MRTKSALFSLIITGSLLVFGCGEDFLAEAEATDTDQKDETVDEDKQDTTDDGLNDDGENDQGLNIPKTASCSTAVQDSFPMGIRTECKIDGNTEAALEFELEYRPLKGDDIRVTIDDEDHTDVSFDPETNTLTVEGLSSKGQTYTLKISYDSEEKYVKPQTNELTFGHVRDASDLDGCQWLIETGDGTKFEPLNLPEEFQVDGKYIQFKHAVPETDIGSICMAGTLVNVSEVAAAASSDDANCTSEKPADNYVCMLVSSGCYQGAAPEEGDPPPTSTWTWIKDGNLQCAPSAG